MKLLKLIKCEFLKLFSKKSTYVMIILAAVITVGISVISKISMGSYDGESHYYYGIEYEKEGINIILEESKGKTDNNSKILVALAEHQWDIVSVKEAQISKWKNKWYSSWQSDAFTKYEDAKGMEILYKLIKAGYSLESIDICIDNARKLMDMNIATTHAIPVSNILEIDKYLKDQEELSQKYLDMVENGTYAEYVSELKQNNEKGIKALNETITELKKTNTEESAKQILNIANQIEMTESIVKVYDYVITKNVATNDWKYQTTNSLIMDIQTLYNSKINILGKEEYYDSREYKYNYTPYETYLVERQSEIETIQNRIDIRWYALENNIAIDVDNAKTSLTSKYDTSIAGIIGIIIAGAIVSQEFSTGTIRFLLTRPVKRWKILMAKLIVILLLVLGIILLTIILTIITTGILYGFSDYLIPELAVKSGVVVEESILVSYLTNVLISMIPTLAFVIFAFAMSTITRSTAFAVGLGLGAWFGAYIANVIIALSGYLKNFIWLKWTPAVYTNVTFIIDQDTASSLDKLYGVNPGMGALVMGAYALVFIVVSFIVFKKIDIKNQ